MDFARFKAAFDVADGSARFQTLLDQVQTTVATTWSAVSSIPAEHLRAGLASAVREKEAACATAAMEGLTDPHGAIRDLNELRERLIALRAQAVSMAKQPAPDFDSGEPEDLFDALTSWRLAVDPDVRDALELPHDEQPDLVDLVASFDEDYREAAPESRDHAAAREVLRKMQNTAVRILEGHRAQQEAKVRALAIRKQVLGPLDTIQRCVDNGDYGEPPSGALAVAVEALGGVVELWVKAEEYGDWTYTEQALVDVAKAVDVVDRAVHAFFEVERSPETERVAVRDAFEADEYAARKAYLSLWEANRSRSENMGLLFSRKEAVRHLKGPYNKAHRKRIMLMGDAKPDYLEATGYLEVQVAIIDKVEELLGSLTLPPDPPTGNHKGRLKAAKAAFKTEKTRASGVEKTLSSAIREAVGDLATGFHGAKKELERGFRQHTRKPFTDESVLAAETDVTDLRALVDALEAAIVQAGRTVLETLEGEGVSVKQLMKVAKDWCKASPEVMRDLSPDTLDAIAAKIGDKARSTSDKNILKAALVGRYDLDNLSGTLSTKTLPRFYKLLGAVPEDHVRTNPRLKSLVRTRKIEGSEYSGSTNEIVMNMPRTWMLGPGMALMGAVSKFKGDQYAQDPDIEPGFEVKMPVGKEFFDHTMFHEIGHAVDERDGFMDKRGSGDTYGAWQDHTVSEVAEVIGRERGLYDDFPDVDRNVLRAYLLAALKGEKSPEKCLRNGLKVGTPGSQHVDRQAIVDHGALHKAGRDAVRLRADGWDAALRRQLLEHYEHLLVSFRREALIVVTRALARILPEEASAALSADDAIDAVLREPAIYAEQKAEDLDWKKLKKHAAVALAKQLRCAGDDGLWDKGKSAAEEVAIDGRVYQEAYSGNWVSYALSARKKGVSAYQFRAPAEWYAEAYGFFYMDRLPKSHPLSSHLEQRPSPN